MAKFSIRLKALRAEKEISQQELANIIGVSKSSINMYERGEREPSFETLESVADYFNVDMDYLMGRQDIPRKIDLSHFKTDFVSDMSHYFKLTDHENNVISAYRNQPEMQPAVDRILGITSEPDYLMPVAAHNDNLDDEQQQLMQNDLNKLNKL